MNQHIDGNKQMQILHFYVHIYLFSNIYPHQQLSVLYFKPSMTFCLNAINVVMNLWSWRYFAFLVKLIATSSSSLCFPHSWQRAGLGKTHPEILVGLVGVTFGM